MPAFSADHPPMPRTGVAAIVFGLMTVFTGAAALFTRLDMGNVVAFVLWFNFLAGFAYIAAGLLIFRGMAGSLAISAALAAASLAVFSAFGVHAAGGGAYEVRTVAAMALRCAFWVGVALFIWKRA